MTGDLAWQYFDRRLPAQIVGVNHCDGGWDKIDKGIFLQLDRGYWPILSHV